MADRWRVKRVRKPPFSHLARKVSRPFRRRTKPGAAPGTIRVDPQSPPPVISVLAYGPGADEFSEIERCDPDALAELLGRFPITWVNVDGLGDAAVIERLGEVFHLHSLALEDVVHVHQRAKVEDYDDHLFVVARMAGYSHRDNGASEGRLQSESIRETVPASHRRSDAPRSPDTEQVSLFLGRNFVLTFQERPGSDSFEPVRTRLRRRRGRIREQGADGLAYALLDAIIDGYFPVIDELSNRLEQLDEDILSHQGSEHLSRLHRLRGDLLLLRKHLLPLREAIHALIRDPHPLISDETHLFLRDCYDHTIQLLDVVETYRELCADLREFHYAQVSTRTNEVVKVLTIISTIFIPLSFVAGVYGMNFDPDLPGNMPELKTPYAYPVVMGVMALIGLVLVGWFWRKGWLGRDER